jgi:DMATS type aromatic prenyltransferase
MLSHDCVVDFSASRIKVYVMTLADNLAKAKDMFHQRGRLSGPDIAASLEAISDFWRHSFGLRSSDSDIDETKNLAADIRCVFVFELRPATQGQNGSDMKVKIYIPPSWLGKTDAQVCEVLSTWFHNHGHPDPARRYQRDLASAL